MVRDALALLADLPQRLGGIGDALGEARQDLRQLVVTGQSQDARVARIEEALVEFNGRFATIETLVSQLAHDVADATDRLPDQDTGPLGKARDILTGDNS